MPDAPEVGISQEQVERKITFTRDFSVALPRGEQAYMIAVSEWNRVKRMVERIVPAKNWFVVAGSICAGVFFSAVFCLIGFAASNDVPVWARSVGWSAAICALVLSASLFYLDSQQRADIRESTDDVTQEMERIEKSCLSEPDERAAPEGQRQ